MLSIFLYYITTVSFVFVLKTNNGTMCVFNSQFIFFGDDGKAFVLLDILASTLVIWSE